MRFKNAGLITKEDAMIRMLKGEVFYSDRGKYFYREQFYTLLIPTPFIHQKYLGDIFNINWEVEKISSWNTECNWYDDLGEGVLCWAWYTPAEKRVTVIKEHKPEEPIMPFLDINNVSWPNAEPLTSEEIITYAAKGTNICSSKV